MNLAQLLGELQTYGEFRAERLPRYLVGPEQGTDSRTVGDGKRQADKPATSYGFSTKIHNGSLASRILDILDESAEPLSNAQIRGRLNRDGPIADPNYVSWCISSLVQKQFIARAGTRRSYFYTTRGALNVRAQQKTPAARGAGDPHLGVRLAGLSDGRCGEEAELDPALSDVGHSGIEV